MAAEIEKLSLFGGDPRITNIPTFYPRVPELEEQSSEQSELVSITKTCELYSPSPITPALARRIRYGWNSINTSKLLRSQFYQEDVLRFLLCAAEDLFLTKSHRSLYEENIRRWFGKLTKLSEGKYGNVYKTKIGGVPFILKVFKDDNIKNVHEAFVGLFGTNQLRKWIPNFAYVFGTFKCPFPERENCCMTGSEKARYVMYEEIQDSQNLEDYLNDNRGLEVDNIILQLCYALHLAHQKIDFTHYDLHGRNVLVRRLLNKVCIPYQTERGRVEYITTDVIPVVVDYGFSHINYRGKHYGTEPIQLLSGKIADLGVRKDASYPFHDVFNIFTSMFYNPRLLKVLAPYFIQNGENMEITDLALAFKDIRSRIGSGFPRVFEHIDYLYIPRIIRKHRDYNFITETPPAGVELWSPDSGTWLSPEEVINKMTGPVIGSELKFHGVASILQDEDKSILEPFSHFYPQRIEEFGEEINIRVRALRNLFHEYRYWRIDLTEASREISEILETSREEIITDPKVKDLFLGIKKDLETATVMFQITDRYWREALGIGMSIKEAAIIARELGDMDNARILVTEKDNWLRFIKHLPSVIERHQKFLDQVFGLVEECGKVSKVLSKSLVFPTFLEFYQSAERLISRWTTFSS
jgi:hypothetical protein